MTLRGNVETRLNQALDGRLDAVVLAWAGLKRLGLERHVTDRLEPPEFLPAVGQGALGIECRRDDAAVLALLQPLDDPATHRAVRAERAALAELEGGCIIPMAAWARDVEGDESTGAGQPDGPALAIDAVVFDPDGRERITASLRGPREDADGLGRRAAQALRDQGAEPLLGAGPVRPRRINTSRAGTTRRIAPIRVLPWQGSFDSPRGTCRSRNLEPEPRAVETASVFAAHLRLKKSPS